MTTPRVYFDSGFYGDELEYKQLSALPPQQSQFPARYERMIDRPPCSAGEADLKLLAPLMIAPPAAGPYPGQPDPRENPRIPAGYTYLGQLIDHDISRDERSILGKPQLPIMLPSSRTWQLDLDCVYGKGSMDVRYHLRNGRLSEGSKAVPTEPEIMQILFDAKGQPLIPDDRNAENMIIMQLHAAFVSFHNRVIEALGGSSGAFASNWAQANQIVRWHYQWIVLNDYLPRICGPTTQEEIRALLDPGSDGKPRGNFKHFKPSPVHGLYVPAEFSHAAFRFGHAMVRPGYFLNDHLRGREDGTDHVSGGYGRRPILDICEPDSDMMSDLRGFRPIPDIWPIQWKYFFRFDEQLVRTIRGEGGHDVDVVFDGPQPSLKIGHLLAEPLDRLPGRRPKNAPRLSLPLLDLLRGRAFGLTSGQEAARFLGVSPILTDAELTPEGKWLPSHLLRDTPLFFYILREAAVLGGPTRGQGGFHLGPLGRAIVLETIAGFLFYDRSSVVHQPGWVPTFGACQGEPYEFRNLLKYVYEDAVPPLG